ncbi:alpha/beta fold hydrolase [Tsuneonella sp. HG222]
MTSPKVETFAGFGGTELALHRIGKGRPVVLLHGLFSDAETNWIKFGHAARLAEAGFEVLMPDLRAHGHSGRPHDPGAYPPDVLLRDVEALVAHLGLRDFDLAGFSLGARTAVGCVVEGIAPRRLVIAGMGMEGLAGFERRAGFFIDAIDRYEQVKRGDPAFFAVAFMKTQKVDLVASRLLLQSVAGNAEADLQAVTMPTLVVCGAQDRDNGSPMALAQALPDGHFVEIPGTHMSSVTQPELSTEIVRFLTA